MPAQPHPPCGKGRLILRPVLPCACVLVIVWRSTRQPCFPLRSGRWRGRPAPLHNRKIAFGRVRRPPPSRCAKAARLRARSSPPLHVGALRSSAPLHSATADSPCLRDALSIRECGLQVLVGIPPVTLQRRLAAPVASRRRIRSGPVAEAPRPLRAKGTVASSAARGLHAARLTWRGVPRPNVLRAETRPIRPDGKGKGSKTPCFSVRSREAGRRIGARAHRRPDATGAAEVRPEATGGIATESEGVF